MTADLSRLAELAKSARDSWVAVPKRVDIDRDGPCDGCAESKRLVASYPDADSEPWLCDECAIDADYTSAASPDVVLDLLERLQQAEALLRRIVAEDCPMHSTDGLYAGVRNNRRLMDMPPQPCECDEMLSAALAPTTKEASDA